MIRMEQIRARLSVLQPLQVELADDSHLHAGHVAAGSGGHYRLKIVSEQFIGKPTVARHRMIYSALGEMMKHEIHALNITASTPEHP
jgi:BolA protein